MLSMIYSVFALFGSCNVLLPDQLLLESHLLRQLGHWEPLTVIGIGRVDVFDSLRYPVQIRCCMHGAKGSLSSRLRHIQAIL